MTTITLTDIDADTVKSIIRNCHAPNEIETGFTPDPIHTMLEQHMIIDRSAVINAIADRFPVYCLEIREETTRMRYYFEISSINLRVWCDISRYGFIIHTPGIEFTNADDVIGFAKGMNAITEWAREAA